MKEIYIVEHGVDDKKYHREFKNLDRGWSYVVLVASFCTCCLIGANNYGTGIIHEILLERYQRGITLTAWSGALQLAFLCVSAPLASLVIDKFSCRTSVILSGLLYICGYLATAFAASMELVIFTCGVLGGAGAGFGYTASIVAIGYNFKKRKNFALGITLSGMGAGIFAFAPLMDFTNKFYGPTGFFIIMATLSANIITFGTLLFPSELEIYTQKDRENTAQQKHKGKAVRNALRVYCKAVLNKPVFLLCLYMFGFCGGTDLVFLHLPAYVISKGFSSQQAAFLVSLNGILSVAGRVLIGVLSHAINEIWLLSVCLLAVGIITVAYPFVASFYSGQVAYSALFGLLFGSGYLLVSPATSHFVDFSFNSAAIGVVLFSGGVGSILGPPLAGWLIDSGGTYGQSIIIAGGCVLAASLFSALSLCFKSKRIQQRTTEKNAECKSWKPMAELDSNSRLSAG